ncbi:MAG: FAD-binding protein [Thermodesulfobacteriota bacterium]|nr:FAD-binding protein [Thermodesulfobacteriota bacterium]
MTTHYFSETDAKEKLSLMRTEPYWWEAPDDAYDEIERIVGSRWISRDKVARQSYYSRGYGFEMFTYLGLSYPPCIVVLPATTQEVADVVKACNKYNLPYLPMSSGWIITATPRFRSDMVLIDLQRMWEWKIDKENMAVTLGSGVRYGHHCQGCIENGLWFINTGGGSASCVIANTLSYGVSPLNYRMGNSERRAMSLEWVTPDGEIAYSGAWAQGEDGIWGDGPGPNLMGILRGGNAWLGGMGIVTRMSVKAFSFVENAPEVLVPEGITPDTHLTFKNSNRIRWINFQFPDRKSMEDCAIEVGHAQIGAAWTKVPVFWRYIAIAKDKEDFWEKWSGVEKEEIDGFHLLRALFVGYTSEKQMEYELKVCEDIMKKHGGKERRTKPSDESWIKNADANGMWMMTSGYISTDGGQESLRTVIETGKLLGDLLYDEYDPYFLPEKGDVGWWQSNDFGHSGYLEFMLYQNVDYWDPLSPFYNPKTREKGMKWSLEMVPDVDAKTGSYNFFGGLQYPLLYAGPTRSDFQVWIDRFKDEFDPGGLANPPAPYEMEEMLELLPPETLPRVRSRIRRAKRGKSASIGPLSKKIKL